MTSVDTRTPGRPDEQSRTAQAPVAPALVRVSVLGGNTQLDVALPAAVPIAALIGDLVTQIASRTPRRRNPDDPETDGDELRTARTRWTLSLIGHDPLSPSRSLSDSGVRDGDLLMITEVRTGDSPVLFDDVVDAVARLNEAGFANWSPRATRTVGFVVTLLAVGVAALCLAGMRWHHAATWPAIPAAIVALGFVTASAVVARHYRDSACATVLAVAAMPCAFVAGLLAAPGGFGAAHLALGFALVLLSAVITYRVSGLGPVWHSAAITGSIMAGAACAAEMLLRSDVGRVAAVTATVGLLVIGWSPRLTIVVAKLPLPPVPTAGSPLDLDDAEPSPAIEGIGAIGAMALPKADALERRSHLANAYLTGIIGGATAVTAPAAVLAATPWAGMDTKPFVLATIIAVVACLRGRSHSDLAQATTLIAGGVLTLAALVLGLAAGTGMWPLTGFVVAIGLACAALAIGVLAPRHEFSPVMRRLAEVGEYALVAVIVPLLLWILDLYSTLRNI